MISLCFFSDSDKPRISRAIERAGGHIKKNQFEENQTFLSNQGQHVEKSKQ